MDPGVCGLERLKACLKFSGFNLRERIQINRMILLVFFSNVFDMVSIMRQILMRRAPDGDEIVL